MKFSFTLKRLVSGEAATLWSFVIDGEEISEYERFKRDERSSPGYAGLQSNLKSMLNEEGFDLSQFRSTGKRYERGVTVVYLSHERTRLYGIYWGPKVWIAGCGGFKPDDPEKTSYQEFPHLNDCVEKARYVDKILQAETINLATQDLNKFPKSFPI